MSSFYSSYLLQALQIIILPRSKSKDPTTVLIRNHLHTIQFTTVLLQTNKISSFSFSFFFFFKKMKNVFYLFFLCVTVASASKLQFEQVHLSSLVHLDFDACKFTTGYKPVQQLQCIGNGCKIWQAPFVQCINANRGETPTAWKCTFTNLPDTVILKANTVQCEGTNNGDRKIRGSCQLTYELQSRYEEMSLGVILYIILIAICLCFFLALCLDTTGGGGSNHVFHHHFGNGWSSSSSSSSGSSTTTYASTASDR